jgi:hypothetical protein
MVEVKIDEVGRGTGGNVLNESDPVAALIVCETVVNGKDPLVGVTGWMLVFGDTVKPVAVVTGVTGEGSGGVVGRDGMMIDGVTVVGGSGLKVLRS